MQNHPLNFTVITFIVTEKDISKIYTFFNLLNQVPP